jgi:hypothetical protein
MPGQAFIAKEVGTRPRGNYKRIVGNLFRVRYHRLGLGINTPHFSQPYPHILTFLKNFPKWKRNIARIQSRGSHLVKEWLKLVVIESVNQGYLKSRLIIEPPSQPESAKSCSYDNDFHVWSFKL